MTKNNPGPFDCHAKAAPDEPLFTLRAKDPVAPFLVRAWTAQLTTIDGVPVRVWDGLTADGIACKVFVHRLAVADNEDTEAFERELVAMLPPGLDVPLDRAGVKFKPGGTVTLD